MSCLILFSLELSLIRLSSPPDPAFFNKTWNYFWTRSWMTSTLPNELINSHISDNFSGLWHSWSLPFQILPHLVKRTPHSKECTQKTQSVGMLSALTSSLQYWCSFLSSFIQYHGLKYHTFTNYYKCISHTVFFLLELHTFRVWEIYETINF